MSDDLDLADLLRDALKQSEKRKWRKDNPYVADLIQVLMPHRQGLHRRRVIEALLKIRVSKKLPIPEAFEQTVQSSFQGHASEYATFKSRHAPHSDDLFYAPRGKGAGYWAVRIDRATVWMVAKNKQA